MWIRMLASVFILAVLAALVSGAAIAVFTDTHTTKGNITAAAVGSISLHICEPDVVPGPNCGSDDAIVGNFADEVVFELDEQLLPNKTTTWDIRLQNDGSAAWELVSVDYTAVETADPGNDCSVDLGRPTVTIRGKAGPDGVYDVINDNPQGFSKRLHWIRDDLVTHYVIDPVIGGKVYRVHVEPGDYEDMKVSVFFPDSGNECQGNVWEISFSWTVQQPLD